MHHITFISTVHKENGKCNSDELCEIIEKISPDVIFLEALENTYSDYDEMRFSSFGVFHNKLEIRAIQKYSFNINWKYVQFRNTASMHHLNTFQCLIMNCPILSKKI